MNNTRSLIIKFVLPDLKVFQLFRVSMNKVTKIKVIFVYTFTH